MQSQVLTESSIILIDSSQHQELLLTLLSKTLSPIFPNLTDFVIFAKSDTLRQ